MARLAISKDYFPAYAALPRKAQRKADEFLRKFEQDPTAASIHLEPIKRVVDAQLRSARIGDDYRVILRAPEQGDVFLVLWADHHDEAYRWASTKQTAVHPATGSLQIFDVTAATAALTTATPGDATLPSTPELPQDLFASRSDDDLFLAGVPRALIPSVRALATDADLDRLLPFLPPEAGEVLTALAAGISLDEALEEVLGRVVAPAAAPAPPPVDVADVPAALARDTTQRQFRLLADGLDLDAALKHPLDVWRVFLHPRQRRLVQASSKGPMRVLGGAGTGKTVVALHRAAHLVREVFKKPDDRVLLTTFTANLAYDLRSQLAKLLEPDELARVEVVNIDAWASQFLRGRGIALRPAFEREQAEHFAGAHEVYGDDAFPLDFYRAEWRDVIQEQGLATEDEYVRAVRKSRGVPLGRAERRRLWPVFAAYREMLEHEGMLEPLDIIRRAHAELEASGQPPKYRAVVVDETQDFTADALRLVRAIAGPEHPDDLFLVGDAHQRIYGHPVALSRCGIQVRGRRSQTLRLNYRTTGAICRWSLGILKDVDVDDLDEGRADRRGYVSLREGPSPTIHAAASQREEEDAVVRAVRAHLDAGTPAEAICVIARIHHPLRDRFQPALERAGIATVVLEQEEPRLPGVRLATMHRAKGLEFHVVLLVSISKHDVPYATPELRSEDPITSAQALLRERSLLYVAASRARDTLTVFYAGEPSPFLASLMTVPKIEAEPAPATRPPAPPATDADDPLATPLQELVELPTRRLLNFCEREGMQTLGDLARRSPAELLEARNLGRKSIQDARRIIEEKTGLSWEEIAQRFAPRLDGADENENETTAATWEELRARLDEMQRATSLTEMDLPARLRTYVQKEGLRTLGDLAARSRDELATVPSLGRTTLTALPGAVIDHFRKLDAEALEVDEGLLESFRSAVEALDPMMRIIITRRSGLAGEPLKLAELGEMFGVSRERVRQLEARVVEQLRRQGWAKRASRRIDAVLEQVAIPLSVLASDPWWAEVCTRPSVVEFVVETLFDDRAHVFDLEDAPWLSRHPASTIASAWQDLSRRAEAIALPAPIATFDELLDETKPTLGEHLAEHFRAELRSTMQLDATSEDGERVLALGSSRAAELLAILRASDAPLHRDELARRAGIGRIGHLPDEAIVFGRGTIGLREHFRDFDEWRSRLVPDSVRIIERLGPERQWHTSEILDELRESHDIPDWLTAYGLGALIRAGDELRYLGRLRVALPGSRENESRIYVHEALEELLKEAGEPVAKGLLLTKLSSRLGATEFAVAQVFSRPQFVRVDGERIGLLARDVPGGAGAIAEAAAHVEALLARRERGLSEFHVHEEVRSLSSAHARWSLELTMSALRAEGRFRFSMSGALGLATWESTRVPTRLELVRNSLAEANGRVSIEAVLARIEAHYGDRPSRATVLTLASHIQASVDGDWLSTRPDATA